MSSAASSASLSSRFSPTRGNSEIPPPLLLDQAAGPDAEVVSGRQLAHADEGGPVGQDRPGRERLYETERIELSTGGRVTEERLRLRREAQVPVELGEEQWPYAEAVASEEELLLAPIPNREREVAVQMVEAVHTPLVVRVRDDLGVRGGLEAMSELTKLPLELDVVVDLAVLHDPVPAVLVRERLVAAGEIDDRKARVRHPEPAVEIQADAVGTTVMKLPRHGEKKVRRGSTPRPGVDARDPTHRPALPRIWTTLPHGNSKTSRFNSRQCVRCRYRVSVA